jgi:NitT/TauT family transport system substrate-binding protein
LEPLSWKGPIEVSRRSKALQLPAALATFALAIGVMACGDDDEGGGGAAEGGGGGQLQQVDYLLPYQDSISFLGLLVAKDGCFAEEGLEVKTIPSNGSDYVVQQLIAGNVKFGQTGADNILIANATGRPVRGIAQVGGRGIFTIVVPQDSEIQSVADLKGAKLGVTDLGGGEIPLVKASIADAGLTEGEDVELAVVGEGGPAALNALKGGEIAAYAGANNDIAGMIAAGLEPREIIADKFQTVPTTEVAVMEETLQNEADREIAIKIARCYRKGSEFAVENPEQALEIACEQVPAECEDPKVRDAFMESVLESYEVPEGAEHYTDHVPQESYDLVQTSLAADDIAKPQDLATVFPDEYAGEVNQE